MTLVQMQLRSVGAAAGGWVRRASYLKKWVVLGTAIGVIAGLGAVLFFWALTTAAALFLNGIGGYIDPLSTSEGGRAASGYFTRWWAIPLVVALGGLISGVIVTRFAPEAQGGGADAAIDAVHRNPRGIRARVVVVKIISSAGEASTEA